MNGDSTNIGEQCHCFEGTAIRSEHLTTCPLYARKPDTHPVGPLMQVCPNCGYCPTCGRAPSRGITVTTSPPYVTTDPPHTYHT